MFVLQYNILYSDLEAAGGWIVLQPGGKLCCKGCIVLQRRGVDELCRNILKCIVTEAAELCHDTGPRHSRAGPRHSRLGAGLSPKRWALGREVRGKQARAQRAGARARGTGAGARCWGARGVGAAAGAQACRAHAAQALGAWPGRAGWPRLCTRCTQPVFGPV